jgi:hypothetical protein
MSTGRPTKAQVVEALMAVPEQLDCSEEWCKLIASILVRAGLAEEPREEGVYATSPYGHENLPLAYWSGKTWFPLVVREDPAMLSPRTVGPRILPPKE